MTRTSKWMTVLPVCPHYITSYGPWFFRWIRNSFDQVFDQNFFFHFRQLLSLGNGLGWIVLSTKVSTNLSIETFHLNLFLKIYDLINFCIFHSLLSKSSNKWSLSASNSYKWTVEFYLKLHNCYFYWWFLLIFHIWLKQDNKISINLLKVLNTLVNKIFSDNTLAYD